MKKKKWIVLFVIVFVISLPFGFFYVLNNGNPMHRYIADRYVPEYLKEQGYADVELADAHFVAPNNSINNDFYHGHYMVKFKDDPEFTYYYGVTKRGKEVKQFCERDWIHNTRYHINYYDKKNKSKHLEDDCVNSLDNKGSRFGALLSKLFN